MQLISRIYLRTRELKGQSMTEYALILAAVAVVAFAVYDNLGNSISNMISNIVTDL
jgi:Flp pilus assembly pilin Flp